MGKNLKGKEIGAGIRQRKSGVYEGRYTRGGVTKSIYNENLEELRRQLEFEKARADENYSVFTLDEWFDEWLETYKTKTVRFTSAETIKARYRNAFQGICGDKNIADITALNIQKGINQLVDEGRSAQYIRNIITELKECFEYAFCNGYIKINPCVSIVLPTDQEFSKEERRHLEEWEQAKFLDGIKTELPWYYEFFYVMFFTGMRIGEIGGLTWDDIDFKKKEIHINHSLVYDYYYGGKQKQLYLGNPKTINSKRTIPFLGEVGEMLRRQKEKQDKLKSDLGGRWRGKIDNIIFTTTMGSELGRQRTRDIIVSTITKINNKEYAMSIKTGKNPQIIEPFYPHAIRHTFCSRCYKLGIDAKTTQKLMGHASITTTMNDYTHFSEGHFNDVVSKFGASNLSTGN